ncbi:hypothetical protein BWGOE8_19320 [Bacillus mycoides]|uniref:Uncharacterized protein n=1 Tax=Bacillus mycoides TaxID=1405 RepID=A0A1E8B9H5_BACMY|nr:hypothetical protein BWGOE8_19320 [Bacillus mycoides]OFD81098.1 hypothetical protein BWGOE9_19010 [Bacillus mycoides]OFD84249.1 hypothetical protein BWGOE10_16710 [Bacillus mycoides]
MLFSILFTQFHQSSLSNNNRENIHGNLGIDPSRLDENIYFFSKGHPKCIQGCLSRSGGQI